MKLEIYRGDIRDAEGGILRNQVGVLDRDRQPNENDVIALTGAAGDPESEHFARRIKAMFEFCEPFAVEFMEQAAAARARRGIENFINTGAPA